MSMSTGGKVEINEGATSTIVCYLILPPRKFHKAQHRVRFSLPRNSTPPSPRWTDRLVEGSPLTPLLYPHRGMGVAKSTFLIQSNSAHPMAARCLLLCRVLTSLMAVVGAGGGGRESPPDIPNPNLETGWGRFRAQVLRSKSRHIADAP